MKFIALALLSLSVPFAHAQMSEAEVSDMCMNQIVAGMVQDKVLGGQSGICVQFNKDDQGNVTGMDFKMNSSAFALGKDQLSDEQQKQRIQTIKDFVVNYQKIVTKNDNVKIDDIDIQVRSYADGVGGPKTYDQDIKSMSKWSDLLNYIGDDKAGVKYLNEIAPKSKQGDAAVDFDKLSPAAQSSIRNIVLGKKRSQTICKEFGISDCDKRKNAGFSSPDLEKRPNGPTRECAERRVSVIKVNLNKAVEISGNAAGVFHPNFAIPEGSGGEEMKKDMQLASFFGLIKRHTEVTKNLKDKDKRQALLDKATQDKKSKDPKVKADAINVISALNSYDPKENNYSYFDLPDEAINSADVRSYKQMISNYSAKIKSFEDKMDDISPDLLAAVQSGDFIGYKEKIDQLKKSNKREKVIEAEKEFLAPVGGAPSTDLLNFFPTSQALQYHFIKDPNSSNLTNASTVLNQSNGELKIKLDQRDLASAKKRKGADDGRAHWQCYGGCESGIHEAEDGSFVTKFRQGNIAQKNSEQIQKEFGDKPTSYGALKSLNVYVIKECANCDCLKQRNVSIDDVLKGPNSTKVVVDKVQKGPGGSREFSQSVGNIADPASTCIFTPPVAHTCKVDPKGTQTGAKIEPDNSPHYGCAMWDKSQHGLKWTANFVSEGLGLADKAEKIECTAKSAGLKEQANSAVCEFSDPAPVPESCQ